MRFPIQVHRSLPHGQSPRAGSCSQAGGDTALRPPAPIPGGSPWHRALRGAFVGFLAYGLWGAAVNFEHGLGTALRVGIGQGTCSFLVTLLLSRLLEALLRWSGGIIWIACALGLVALHGGSLIVHLAIATPELAISMAPGLLIGTVYVPVYLRGLLPSAGGAPARGMGAMRFERVDLVRLRSSAADVRWAAARRIFKCWQPLFPHLADKEPSFILKKHVDDPTPVMLRANFVSDLEGRDRGLLITRFRLMEIAGQSIGLATLHAGMHKPVRTRDFGLRIIRDLIEFHLRHPRTPLYFAELLTHPAVYVTLRSMFRDVAPGHNAQLDREQTAIVECVAATHNAVPLVGSMLGLCQAAIASPKARAVTNDDARWFTEHVKPGTGLVVIAPMSVGDVLGSLVRLIAWRARRSLGRWRLRRHRRTPIGSTNMGSSGRASRPV
jgi:hypothetical protein